MALEFISEGAVPAYLALSTDIADSKIPGASLIGKLIYLTDSKSWLVINTDLTVSEYVLAFGGSIDVGDVTLLQSTAEIGKLGAGTAVIGKVGIDQSVSGTTNKVSIDQTTMGTTNAVSRAATVVTPSATASTNTYVLVPNALIDTLNSFSGTFTILNTGADSINWKVLAGNGSGLTEAIEAQAEATVTAGAYGTFSVTPAIWRYYGVYIMSSAPDTPGEATVVGTAKG